MVNKREIMRRGFTLLEIMIVVAIIALLGAIAIPNLLKSRITANEAAAQATLRNIAVAMETYAATNSGVYPDAEAKLLPASLGGTADPPYLNKAYNGVTESGYKYAYTLTTTSYIVTARPISCTTTGTKSFQITTGSVLSTDVSCIPAS